MYSANSTLTVQVRDYPSRLLVRFKSEQEATFIAFKEIFRLRFSPRWSRADRAWFVPTSERGALRDWLTLHVGADDLVWIDDVDPRARGYGYTRPSPLDDPLVSAYRTLHLLPTAPPEVVAAAHRALVKLHHPDVAGGEHTAAVTINQAITAIRAATAR